MAYVYWPRDVALRRHAAQRPPAHHDHSGTHGRRKVWYHHAHEWDDRHGGLFGGQRMAYPRRYRCEQCVGL